MRFAGDWSSHVGYSLPAILKGHNPICMSSNSLILVACSITLQYHCYQICCLPIHHLKLPDISCFRFLGVRGLASIADEREISFLDSSHDLLRISVPNP